MAIADRQGIITLTQSDGKTSKKFLAHQGEISEIRFNPVEKIFATIGEDNYLKIWDYEGNLQINWQPHNQKISTLLVRELSTIQNINFSPEGKTLITIGGRDRQIKLWSLKGQLIKNWTTEDNLVYTIDFYQNNLIVTRGNLGLKFWQLDGKLLTILPEKQNKVTQITFSNDRKYLATLNEQNQIKIWNSEKKLLQTISSNKPVQHFLFTPKQKLLIVASKKEIEFYNFQGKLLQTIPIFTQQHSLTKIQISADEKTMAIINDAGNIFLWNLDLNLLQQHIERWMIGG